MSRPTRILIFDRGITSHYTVGLALGLESHGADVVIAGPAGSGRAGVVAVYPREGVVGKKWPKTVEALGGAGRLASTLRRWQPDVLHFQWSGMPNYVLARLSAAHTGAPLVYTVHNPVPRGSSLNRRFDPKMVGAADALIVHGPTMREELLRRYHLSKDLVHVLPHGNHEHAVVRYDRGEARRRLGLPEDGPVFAFVGQLLPRKGIDTLLASFRLHCERGHPGTLVLAGPVYGVDLEALRLALAPHDSRVCWLTTNGQVPAETLDLVTSAATQVVLPFREATQSGSVIYAMTHGRCVVSTSVGEIPATVGKNGILVPPADVQALASALETAQDLELCDRLGRAAREFVLSELDWSNIAAQTLRIYEGVLQQGSERIVSTHIDEPKAVGS